MSKNFKISNFFKNIGYLFKCDLKKIHKEKISKELCLDIIEGAQFKPNIKNCSQTISELIANDYSLCRFGDGEFILIFGDSIPFQDFNSDLQARLKEILKTNKPNILIGIPYSNFNYDFEYLEPVKKFLRHWVLPLRTKIAENLNLSKQYYDAACTQPYMLYAHFDFDSYFKNIRKIWDQKNITIICGETVFNKITPDIFDNALSIDYLYAPSKNAFSEYDHILEQSLKIDKSRLVIIILGPTATVLAYDLANQGYRALDFGHIAKDYQHYKDNKERSSSNLADFFSPD